MKRHIARLEKLLEGVKAHKAKYNNAKSLQDQVLALRLLCDAYDSISVVMFKRVVEAHNSNVRSINRLNERLKALEESKPNE